MPARASVLRLGIVRSASRSAAVVAAAALVAAGAASGLGTRSAPTGAFRPVSARPMVRPAAFFVANRGQFAPGVAFRAGGPELVASIGSGGIAFARPAAASRPGAASWAHRLGLRRDGSGGRLLRLPGLEGPGVAPRLDVPRAGGDAPEAPAVETARLAFVGARPGARPEGRDALPTRVSYFKGPRERWVTGAPAFGAVVYRELWPGIDLVLRGAEGGVTYGFDLRPGADPGDIRLDWDGDPGVRADVEGSAPPSFEASGRLAARPEDAAYPVYAGFFGGAGFDRGLGIAVDDAGSAYLCGETTDPTTQDTDAYVAKVSADGASYAYVAIVGGDGYDAAFDVAVDAAGSAYFTGVAMSDEASFPVTLGPDLTHNGVIDTAVVKVAPDGADLAYAGFLGGELTDFGEGIRVGADGSAYVHGIAMSTEATFPVKVGPDLTFNGETDAFVAKVRPVPDASDVRDNLDYAGYVGGDGSDITLVQDGTYSTVSSGHIAIDAAGALYVSGETTSLPDTFPGGAGFGDLPGADRTYAGGWDAYVVKVAPDGAGLEYATYVGGEGMDWGKGMTVDAAGSAYLTGYTTSTEATMPVVVGPDLTANGDFDALIGKLTPAGDAFAYLGFLGGDDTDAGEAVAVDAEGRLHVVGYAESGPATFPAKGGPDDTQNDLEEGAGDGFVARIAAVPDAADPADNVDFAGYIGGGGQDQAYWVALDPAGAIHVAGDTASGADTFPDGQGMAGLPGPGAEPGGNGDGFVVELALGDVAPTPRVTKAPTREPTATPRPGGEGGTIHLPVALGAAELGGTAGATALERAPLGRAGEGISRTLAGLLDPAQGGGETRSYDDFCDFVAGWAWEDDDEVEAHVRVDPEDATCDYYMAQHVQGAYATTSDGHVANGDFRVETLVRMHGTSGSAGLLFGIPPTGDRFTIVAVTDPGRYVVARYAAGSTTILQRGDAAFDPAEPLVLAADVRSDAIDVRVNGQLVGTVPDDAPHDGRVGVYTEWGGEGDAPYWNGFDWIRIAAPAAP